MTFRSTCAEMMSWCSVVSLLRDELTLRSFMDSPLLLWWCHWTCDGVVLPWEMVFNERPLKNRNIDSIKHNYHSHMEWTTQHSVEYVYVGCYVFCHKCKWDFEWGFLTFENKTQKFRWHFGSLSFLVMHVSYTVKLALMLQVLMLQGIVCSDAHIGWYSALMDDVPVAKIVRINIFGRWSWTLRCCCCCC